MGCFVQKPTFVGRGLAPAVCGPLRERREAGSNGRPYDISITLCKGTGEEVPYVLY